MSNSTVTDLLKLKKIDIDEKINNLSNIIRNPRQERTLQALILEKNDIEIRIFELDSGQPLDLSIRNYSLSEDQDSASDLSDKTIQLLDNPHIAKEEKLEIIQKRRIYLQSKQKSSTFNFKIYFYYINYFIILKPLFFYLIQHVAS